MIIFISVIVKIVYPEIGPVFLIFFFGYRMQFSCTPGPTEKYIIPGEIEKKTAGNQLCIPRDGQNGSGLTT